MAEKRQAKSTRALTKTTERGLIVSGQASEVRDPIQTRKRIKSSPASGQLIRARGIEFVPALILKLGADAAGRFLTYFTDNIRNVHTRRAYHRWVLYFFDWCDHQGLDFQAVQSFHVSAFIEGLLSDQAQNIVPDKRDEGPYGKSSVKQALAAVRMLYDWLIIGQVSAINPAHAVRGPKHVVTKGLTPVLDDDEMVQLLNGIDTSDVVGLRDRALIGMMVYTFGRVGAVTAMNVRDYFPMGKRWHVRLHEKGGKEHELPVHSVLEKYLDEYLQAAGIGEEKNTPLFRTAFRKTKRLTGNRIHERNVLDMTRSGPARRESRRPSPITRFGPPASPIIFATAAREKRCRHNAPQTLIYPASSQPFRIGVFALLELAQWCQHRLEETHGGDACTNTRTSDGLLKKGAAASPAESALATPAQDRSTPDRSDCGADDGPADPSFGTKGGIA